MSVEGRPRRAAICTTSAKTGQSAAGPKPDVQIRIWQGLLLVLLILNDIQGMKIARATRSLRSSRACAMVLGSRRYHPVCSPEKNSNWAPSRAKVPRRCGADAAKSETPPRVRPRFPERAAHFVIRAAPGSASIGHGRSCRAAASWIGPR